LYHFDTIDCFNMLQWQSKLIFKNLHIRIVIGINFSKEVQ